MLSFLSLIPLKDWVYGGVIAAILACVGLYTYHERGIGAAHEKAAVAKAVAKQDATIQKVVSHANSEIAQAATVADSVLAHPAPPDSPHVWLCDQAPAASPRPVQAPRSTSPAVHVPAESTVEHPRDVGPALDIIGRDADAEIAYLQSYIRACQDAGYCSK